MSRWIGFLVCAIFSVVLILFGLLVPAHLRAVDAIVLQRAGIDTPSLVSSGLALVKSNQLGAAQIFLTAAQSVGITATNELVKAVDELARQQPSLRITGIPVEGRMGKLFEQYSGAAESKASPSSLSAVPFTEFIVRSDKRTKALQLLQGSPNLVVQGVLHFRSVSNTVLFPASSSSSGQALDTAISVCGLLAQEGHFSSAFSRALLHSANEANLNTNSQPLEQSLMDLMSLGQRFNWGQLATLAEQITDPESLHVLSDLVRRGENVPVLYAAVCLATNAAGVAKYVTNFSESGLNDLRLSLAYGAGGVNELLQCNQRLCDSGLCARMAALASAGKNLTFVLDYAWREPMLGLAGKWMLYLLGGFFTAAAFHYARRVTTLEKPLEVRGFHLAREFLFALGFLLVVLLLSEPFLSQGSQKGAFSFQLRLPMVGGPVPTGNNGARPIIMNQVTLLTMLLFFVLQSLLYVASLVKLAEIRRQRVSPRMKLKLLENEDHLFDAGLYLGFLGTIISLILVSLGVFKQPSLMAAYSSTSFGILFVVLFKVLHLRRTRRHLLLEAEAEPPIRVRPPDAPTLSAPL